MKREDTEEGVLQLIRLAEDYADVSGLKSETPPEPKKQRDEWLRSRKKGLGGSDAAAVCGVDPYRTPLDVYRDKTTDGIESIDNLHMKRGRKLEALILREYAELHPEDTLIGAPMTRHPQHSWMLGTPDSLISSPRHTKQGQGVVEVKCPAKHSFEKIKLRGIPAHYVLQMQHYLAITGLKWGVFVVFNADSWEMLTIEVEAFSPVDQAKLIHIEERFWNEHVVPCIPPEEAEKDRIVLPKVSGAIKDRADAVFAKAAAQYVEAQRVAKESADLQEDAKAMLKQVINSESGVFEGGGYRVYNTVVAGRKTLDKKALAASKAIDRVKMAVLMTSGMDKQDVLNRIADGEADLDLADFEEQGNDFTTMKVYQTRETE